MVEIIHILKAAFVVAISMASIAVLIIVPRAASDWNDRITAEWEKAESEEFE